MAGAIAGAINMVQPESERLVSETAADPSSLDAAPAAPSSPGPIAAPSSRRRRRWYQFSVWSLFALTLLAGLTLLGWRWTIAPYRQQARTMNLVELLGGSYESNAVPKWMSRLAGEELGNVTLVNLADCDQPEEYLSAVARLPRLEILVVGGKSFTDEHVEGLAVTTSLQWLILDCTAVSDDALTAVQTAKPDLKVYRSQRRTIAAVKAAGSGLFPKKNPNYAELEKRLGAGFFDEPTFVEASQRIEPGLIADLRSLDNAMLLGPIADADLPAIARSPSYLTAPRC